MMNHYIQKIIVSLVIVLWYVFLPKHGYPGDLSGHFVYVFSHANIFHLLANLLCFWLIPCRLFLLSSYLIGVLCSFLPCFCSEETVGMSGVLFAIVGISWGRIGKFRDMVWRNKWFLVIPLFLPHVNGLLHIYCMLVGYLFGLYERRREVSVR